MAQKYLRQESSKKETPSILERLRDKAYDIVYSEGDFILQFAADLIRGPDPVRETKHLNRQVQHWNGRGKRVEQGSAIKPLTYDEQAIFVEILRRKPHEPQIAYWKRKKALLQTADKHGLIEQHLSLQKELAKRANKQSTPKPEFRSIAQNYQKSLAAKQRRSRTMKRR